MVVIITDMDMPSKCGECPFCIYTADEKRCIGYCNTSDEDYYCKALDRFMEYDKVDGGLDILGKPSDCPLKSADEMIAEIEDSIKACEDLKNDKVALAIESKESYDTRILTYRHSLKIIHKYCDKENKNEDQNNSNRD